MSQHHCSQTPPVRQTGPEDNPPDSAARPRKATQPRTINYPFDPVPKIATDMVAAAILKPIDLEVLAILLRFPRRIRTSCWTTWSTIASLITSATTKRVSQETTLNERTVRRSFYRMRDAGIVRHIKVDVPDPDEPRNKTGWRIVFAWMENEGGANESTKYAHAHAHGSGVTHESTPPGHTSPPPLDTRVHQEKTEGIPLPPGVKQNQNDDDAFASESESSSSFSLPVEEEDPEDARLIAEARRKFYLPNRQRVDILLEVYPREWVETAILVTPRLRDWTGVMSALENWKKEGGPTLNLLEKLRQFKHPQPRKPIVWPEEPPECPEEPSEDPYQDFTPEQRADAARAILGRSRDSGTDFRWSEETGRWMRIKTVPGAIGPLGDDEKALRDEIIAILDQERAQPGWVNPVPCPQAATSRPDFLNWRARADEMQTAGQVP